MMWPQALQMTRDECRGILRRLELESYSHVISVFRAQGGLNENKAKLLEELRAIFHISQERHRAEARRVANDEQLSTIAEAISGPNTWQEWSREGRRSFPMLPRVAPQTALALIANSVAAETAAENVKLPYPMDTGAAIAAEQAAHEEVTTKAAEACDVEKKRWNIVSSDPFKVPDIPVAPKKPLKRNMPDNQNANIKRRSVNDVYTTKQQQIQQQQQQKEKQNGADAGDALSPNSNIRKLYHNYSKIQQQQKLRQQQQTQKQRSVAKKAGTAQTKRQAVAKGKRAQILIEQQQKQQQQQQSTAMSVNTQELNQQQQVAHAQMSNLIEMQSESVEQCKEVATIAASKKDISKNLSKLHIPAVTASSATSLRLKQLEAFSNSSSSSTTQFGSKPDKQLISTPVQKYIVEDRQSPAVAAAAAVGQSSSMSPQIMSASANKLRTVSTSLLPPGTKLSATKKLPTTGTSVVTGAECANQPQVFNIIEGTTITSNVTIQPAAHPPPAPTHAPPAIIQLNNTHTNNSNSSSAGSGSGEHVLLQPSPSQGKVLTTKLLPIVLSSNSASKIETLNNGATVDTGNVSVFKTLPSSMLVSTSGSSNTLNRSTTIGAGGHPVFRKQPNIIKAGKISTAYNTSSSNVSNPGSGGAQIISNIKLSPAIVTSTAGAAASTQQFIKSVGGSSIRTSVKICQSPNGKMFIQSANPDALKKTKLQTSLQQKLIPTQFSSSTSGSTSSAAPQRIAIQKVQIIPAPMSSPGSLGGSLQTHQQKSPSSITISNKANMIFMPTTCGARGTATISLSKTGCVTNISGKNNQQTDVSKQNVFVIGAVAQQQRGLKSISREVSNQMITEDTPVDILNMPIIVDNSNSSATKSVSNSPTALLTAGGNNIGDTVTVLSNEILANASSSSLNPQSSSAVVLGVTDWEMELDQATAVAAATKAARTQNRGTIPASKLHHNTTIVVDDNFDDVIVEEAFTDEAKGNQTQREQDQQFVQQFQPALQTLHDDDMPIEVIDEDQQQQLKNKMKKSEIIYTSHKTTTLEHQKETKAIEQNIIETYDDAIAAEMDENNAIEYIEEDHNDESFDEERVIYRIDTKMRKSQDGEQDAIPISSKSENMDIDTVLMRSNNAVSVDGSLSTFNNCAISTTCKESIIAFEHTEVDAEAHEVTKNNSLQGK